LEVLIYCLPFHAPEVALQARQSINDTSINPGQVFAKFVMICNISMASTMACIIEAVCVTNNILSVHYRSDTIPPYKERRKEELGSENSKPQHKGRMASWNKRPRSSLCAASRCQSERLLALKNKA